MYRSLKGQEQGLLSGTEDYQEVYGLLTQAKAAGCSVLQEANELCIQSLSCIAIADLAICKAQDSDSASKLISVAHQAIGQVEAFLQIVF